MKQDFFINNRQQLMRRLPASLVVLANYYETQRRHDETNLFISESNFWYLTGISDPGWRLIIDTKRNRSYAVAPKLSEVKQVFDGGLNYDVAQELSGVDEVISTDEADSLLIRLRREHRLVYMVEEAKYIKKQAYLTHNGAQNDLHEYLSHRFESVRDARDHLEDMRAIKQPQEIEMIKKAAAITRDAYQEMVSQLPSLKCEYEVEALLNYEFRRRGGDGPAYHTIVAGGKNACTLHYINNNDRLQSKSILLVDAAASYSNYSADVTRCFPIGQATSRQERVYKAVKDVFSQLVKEVKPGLALSQFQARAGELTREALASLDLPSGDEDVWRYFPHAIGHSLGIDTHDTFGSYHELKPGMVLTIEPGIYIPEESIGVRYEDDFLVTDDGVKNLTKSIGDVWYNKD